ncbi:MAG: DUF4474 domain-containing protein [Clostridium sp.]|nr:DUF4474 domain-containing protein [Clostridium sp.]
MLLNIKDLDTLEVSNSVATSMLKRKLNEFQNVEEFNLSTWGLFLLITVSAIATLGVNKLYKALPELIAEAKEIFGIVDDDDYDYDYDAGYNGPKQLTQGELNAVIDKAGYGYDGIQDIFFSTLDAWQRKYGYCRLFDESAAPMGMIIDCEPIYFRYDNKDWLIEFWKGQYDLTTGCEIGVYKTSEKELNIYGGSNNKIYEAVGNDELIEMECSLKKNGKELFKRKDKHWWLTGFVLGEYSEPQELVMDLSITLPEKEMLNAFVEALRNTGYTDRDLSISGNTVYITFDKPYTKQPYTRTKETDEIIQLKNEAMCLTYQRVTENYTNALDKINGLLREAPELYDKFIDITGMKKLTAINDRIRGYL